MLTHYTDTADKLTSILKNGFVWVHNKRDLIGWFLHDDHNFQEREPQQFGMISLTELDPLAVQRTGSRFGRFGITMSRDWLRRHRADRVIYVANEGPAFEAWKAVFHIAYLDLKARIRFPSDRGWTMSYENKTAAKAVAGASLWANMLQLYEYMEPAVYAHECEWRVVRDYPLYNAPLPPAEAVAKALPPRGWGKHVFVLQVRPGDVTEIVCPREDRTGILEELPDGFDVVPVTGYDFL